MEKLDIAEPLTGEAGIAEQATQGADGALFVPIGETLPEGEDGFLLECGEFSGNDRPACQGGNPSTREGIAKKALAGVSFKADKVLKHALK